MSRLCSVRFFLTVLFLLITLCGANTFATEEFAEQTGQDCSVCHVDPAGGGELTDEGQGFALSLATSTGNASVARAPSGKTLGYFVRLIAGYMHILFAIFWFGTILYVHLVLKPAYASAGLPRGEVKVGLLSMFVMAVSGAILVYFRVSSADMLLSTRFGILLLVKIGIFLLMLGSALFVVFFIGPRLRRKQSASHQTRADDQTLGSLTQHDGKDGRPAHIAYQGKVYDVSQSRLWKNGSHLGRHQAGTDLTDVLAQAPHGEEKVLAMPCLGELKASEPPSLTPPQKVFYFMAYMNLTCVFLVVLILTFWKWL